jgi:hypothetical protein
MSLSFAPAGHVPEGQMTVARRFIAGVRDYMACVPGGTPEFSAGGSFYLEPIQHAGFVATQNQLQASLRDADLIDGQPGDKSPGYYRLSLWDEGKTGFQMSKVQSPAGQ